MPSLRKRDKIMLLDGSPGHIEDVVKTDMKTVYKIRLANYDTESYFEADKIILKEQHPMNLFIERLSRFFGVN